VHQFDQADACFAAVRHRYERILTTHLGESSVGLYQLDLTRPTALVFGNEHSGVSDEIRALADGNFLIPQVGIIQSLNISVACAVTLYEAYRQKDQAGHYRRSDLDTEFKQKIWSEWSGIPESES
jgi:tRNA (guanosine-2'-O-)-methyltransferase